jgi:hypothetical protein
MRRQTRYTVSGSGKDVLLDPRKDGFHAPNAFV